VPSSYSGTSAVPFIIDFHGMGDTPDRQKAMSGFLALSDSNGFLIAWPTGIDKAWNFGPCCTCSKTVDDLGFAKAIVAEVEAMACIDAKRVYANGFSIGAAMTNYVACNGADVFAAATPSASDLLGSNQTPCNPIRPISVLAFRGTADPTVSYAGGSAVTPNSCPATLDLLGAVASFNKWATIDACTGTPTTTNVTNPNGTQMLYTQCAGGTEVGLYTIQGGAHAPGPADVAWNFLKTKSLP
jgi:polyhydroxybutyrate depolymerase